MDKIIRVDLSRGTVAEEAVPEAYRLLGGRGLTSRLVADEVPPGCDPLGEQNKLVFAPGLLAGTAMSSSARLSAGAKSPLTGGIKESNAGGTAALSLSRLGVKALVIEGAAQGEGVYLYLDKNGAALRPADGIAGRGVYAAAGLLRERHGARAALIITGPAGESGFAAAGIAVTDPRGVPGRFCGRGGLGAVLGSKGLKAIVVNPDGAVPRQYADRRAFVETARALNRLLKETPQTGEIYPKYGTAIMVARTNAMHALPTRNFSQGSFEHADRIGGEALYRAIHTRGGAGAAGHACMPGCVIRCSNIYPDAAGRELVAPLEYETIGLLGSNCGIGSLDEIARLNYLCNDLGLDTIEFGAALGVAMEQGLIPFGDAAAAENLLAEVGENTYPGRVLAMGALAAGRAFGSRRIPVVKGQAMAAYDPRAVKGFGVTYATSPMGADHTAGSVIRAQVDHTDPAPQPALSRRAQLNCMVVDWLGLCLFTLAALGGELEKVAGLVTHLTGASCSEAGLLETAAALIRAERGFNARAGFGPDDDRLPAFMQEEPLPGPDTVFDVPGAALDRVHD